jgi:hypothetical protein
MQSCGQAEEERDTDADAKAGVMAGVAQGAVEFGQAHHDARGGEQGDGPHAPVDAPDDERDQYDDTDNTLRHTH